MKKLFIISVLFLFAGIVFGQTLKKNVVVGTFDSRVIAVAYYNTEAEASGDKVTVQRIGGHR